jgi:hypothetical protein
MKKKLLIFFLGGVLLTACNFKSKGKVEEATDSTELLQSVDDTLPEETAIDDSGEAVADDTIQPNTTDEDIPATIEPE